MSCKLTLKQSVSIQWSTDSETGGSIYANNASTEKVPSSHVLTAVTCF
jgi:hypothetical protein